MKKEDIFPEWSQDICNIDSRDLNGYLIAIRDYNNWKATYERTKKEV